jgi:hypothetical protein
VWVHDCGFDQSRKEGSVSPLQQADVAAARLSCVQPLSQVVDAALGRVSAAACELVLAQHGQWGRRFFSLTSRVETIDAAQKSLRAVMLFQRRDWQCEAVDRAMAAAEIALLALVERYHAAEFEEAYDGR